MTGTDGRLSVRTPGEHQGSTLNSVALDSLASYLAHSVGLYGQRGSLPERACPRELRCAEAASRGASPESHSARRVCGPTVLSAG